MKVKIPRILQCVDENHRYTYFCMCCHHTIKHGVTTDENGDLQCPNCKVPGTREIEAVGEYDELT
jgi:hypothetical protein